MFTEADYFPNKTKDNRHLYKQSQVNQTMNNEVVCWKDVPIQIKMRIVLHLTSKEKENH